MIRSINEIHGNNALVVLSLFLSAVMKAAKEAWLES
jgi:hypothetical protein